MKRVLITRQAGRSQSLIDQLQAVGIEATEIPLIEIGPVENPLLDQAFRAWESWDWLLLTSVNAVEVFVDRARQAGCWPPVVGPRIAVVGPASAKAVRGAGAQPNLIAKKQRAEGLVEELADQARQGKRFLWPSAALASAFLVQELTRLGGQVQRVDLYRTRPAAANKVRLNHYLQRTPPDLILLTSSSTAQNLFSLCDDRTALRSLPCAVIGPVTAQEARELGLRVELMPKSSDLDSLARAVADHLIR